LTFGGFIPLYLTSQGNSTMFGGTAVAIFQFFTTIGILIGGHLFDKIGPKKLLILSFIFVLPFGLAFINLPSVLGLVFLAIMGFFLSSSTPVNILLGQEMVPTQASLMSSIMMGLAWGVAGLFMTPIGAIADAIGLYWTLTIISSLSVVGLILVYIFRLEERAEAV
jgi:FSR family fosmidomycin resistance protein-like MFS transporter